MTIWFWVSHRTNVGSLNEVRISSPRCFDNLLFAHDKCRVTIQLPSQVHSHLLTFRGQQTDDRRQWWGGATGSVRRPSRLTPCWLVVVDTSRADFKVLPGILCMKGPVFKWIFIICSCELSFIIFLTTFILCPWWFHKDIVTNVMGWNSC